jgi:hypothetical protein
MPALKCSGGENCGFSICLDCCNDDTKLKCKNGHAFWENDNRKQNRVTCSYCGEFSKGIVSDFSCSIDVCIACSNKDGLDLLNVREDRDVISGTWTAENPIANNKALVDLREDTLSLNMYIAESGVIKGTLNGLTIEGWRYKTYIGFCINSFETGKNGRG